MAKERIVNVRFWRDHYIIGLKPDARLLFLWAITNPATELCGAYETPLPTIEAETGIRAKRVREIFDEFETAGKMIYKDGWVIIRNFSKHQHGTSTNIKKAIERTLNDCPDWVKDTLSNGINSRSHLDLDLDPVGQPIPSGREAVAEAAPPAPTTIERTDDRLPGESYFDHPAVQVYEEKFCVKVSRAFAKEIVENVHDLTLWNRLITKKIAFAAGSTKDRQRIATWFLSAYFEELEKQNGTNRPKSFQDQRAERAATDHRFTNDLRQRVTERNRKLLGSAVSGSDRQLQPVESIANGGGEGGAG